MNLSCDKVIDIEGGRDECGAAAKPYYGVGGRMVRCRDHAPPEAPPLPVSAEKFTFPDGTTFIMPVEKPWPEEREQCQAVGAAPDDSLSPWPQERSRLSESPNGVKFDADKPMLDLISPRAEEGLGLVLTYGASKYRPHNWRKGLEWSRVVAALKRHLNAFERGEDLDPESGLPHIDHVMCNAMFLSEFQKTGTGTDDRYRA